VLRKLLIRIGWTLSGLLVAYLLLGNVLLNSSIGESLANRKPEKFRISWDFAYTPWPGVVRASNVRMAGHSRRTVWAIQAERIGGRVALLPLLAREVRVPLAWARNVSGGATRIDVDRQPAPARPGGWTLRFDRIEATQIRQANYAGFVLRGTGIATVRFAKQMRGGPMEIFPSSVGFTEATAWLGGEEVLQHGRITASGSLDRHLREEAPGVQKLMKTSATIEIDAQTQGLHVEAAREKSAQLAHLDRPGRLQGRLAWNRGSLEPGSTLAVVLPIDSEFIEADRTLEASARLDVGADGMHARMQIAPGERSHLHADLDLRIAGRQIPLTDPKALLERTDGHLRAQWQFDSLAWLGELVPGSKLVTFDGAGRVESDLVVARGRLQPGSRFVVPRVDASAVALGNVFRGDANAEIVFESAGDGQLRTRLDATMDHFRVAPLDRPGDLYVVGRNLRLELASQGELGQLKEKYRARMVFSDASVPDLRVYNAYLPQGPVKLQRGSGTLSGDLRFDGAGEVADGSLTVAGRKAAVSVGDALVRGNFRLDTQIRRADLQKRLFVADGTLLAIDSLEIDGPAGATNAGWWGKVVLPEASLGWGRPMRLDGRARIDVRDLEPLLVLFAQKKEFPGWINKLLDEGEARIDGRVSWQNGLLILDEVNARNDRFEVLARLESRNKVRTGDLYARWGKLSLGMELQGGKRDMHLVGARHWYDSQPSLRSR
jgi:hypothetical protein